MIFLTGMPRCGSTWAGRALAHLTRSRYVHEPVNGHREPQWAEFNMRYYRADSCDARLMRALRSSVLAPDRRTRWVRGRKAAVLKEVHCTLAVACVDRHLTPDVVIMIRHPGAVAASWKGLGWMATPWAEGDRLLTQKDLLEDHLAPFETHILSSRDPFFRLGAYWGSIYHVLHRLAASHPRWQWITHEDLCSAPRERFAELLRGLRRTAEPGAYTFFDRHDRPPAPDEGPYDIHRETGSEPEKWKALLSRDEVSSVLAGAEPFAMENLCRPRIGRE